MKSQEFIMHEGKYLIPILSSLVFMFTPYAWISPIIIVGVSMVAGYQKTKDIFAPFKAIHHGVNQPSNRRIR